MPDTRDVAAEIADITAIATGDSIPAAFLRTAAARPDAVSLRWKDPDGWHEWTWAEVADRVARAVTSLRDGGLQPGQRVVLLMRNRPEFHVVDLAVQFCGATPTSVYGSSSPEQVRYLADKAEARVAVAEDVTALERFLEVRAQLPLLAHLVVLDDPARQAPPGTPRWDDLMAAEPADLGAALASHVDPAGLATVIFTSGTTGPPKGVEISQFNVAYTVEQLRRILEIDELAGKRLVSYLPMAHIAERMVSHYGWASFGFEVSTCPEPGQIATYTVDVHPNIIFGVPRVWEKVYSGVNAVLALDPDKKQKFDEAVEAARPIVDRMAWGTEDDTDRETWGFLDAVAFSQVRPLIGLDELDLAVSGAAPLAVETFEWLRAIGVPISEVYGLSETTGVVSYAPRKVRAGSVGPPLPGLEVRLGADGEILCRGGNVFGGYLSDPDHTAEALDGDGWFHTGDIGQFDDDGYLRVVDRKKELLITAGGKNISPSNLEAALRTIPLVLQACAIGDDRPYVAALLVLDPDAAPAWARAHDIAFATIADLVDDAAVRAEVQRGVDAVNGHFNHAEGIKRFTLLADEWLPDSDVLTPTSKLKRRGIADRFADEIEALYS